MCLSISIAVSATKKLYYVCMNWWEIDVEWKNNGIKKKMKELSLLCFIRFCLVYSLPWHHLNAWYDRRYKQTSINELKKKTKRKSAKRKIIKIKENKTKIIKYFWRVYSYRDRIRMVMFRALIIIINIEKRMEKWASKRIWW